HSDILSGDEGENWNRANLLLDTVEETELIGPTEDGQSARIRAYASFDKDRLEEGVAPFSLIGQGYLAVLIDQGEGMVPYQGITPIAGGSLSACAETYFAQSEQLPTRFAVTFGRSQTPGTDLHWRAGGVMLQHMPKASPFVAEGAATRIAISFPGMRARIGTAPTCCWTPSKKPN
ncbi:MAG: molecular chaperone Hsp33, partial [Pseudomonadota bacterium]